MGLLQPHERHRRRHGQAALKEAVAAVVVGGLAEARLAKDVAAQTGRPLLIVASPAFGWPAVANLSELAAMEIAYDPAGRAGYAADALQRGARTVLFPSDDPRYQALHDLAEACGARLIPPPPAPLVLALADDPNEALAQLCRSSPSP